MARIYRCARLQNKMLFIAKGRGAPRKADFFACLSSARPKPMPIQPNCAHPHARHLHGLTLTSQYIPIM